MNARDRVLAAAMGVFSLHGYRNTSMEMIAEALGVTRQAVYRHFANKEELLVGVVENLHMGALQASEAAIAHARGGSADLPEILVAALDARFGHILAQLAPSPHAAELLEENNRQCGPTTVDYRLRFVALLAATIDEQLARDGTKLCAGLSVEQLARFIFLSAQGLKGSTLPPAPEMLRKDLERFIPIVVAGAISSHA